MREFYGPVVLETEELKGAAAGRDSIFAEEGRRFIERSHHEIVRQFDDLAGMFGQACYRLRLLMPEQADNSCLIRYLLEEEGLVEYLWSESIDSLFADMYEGQPEQGYLVAARSYLEGHWYRQALDVFRRVLQHDRHNEEARRQLLLLPDLISRSYA